MDLTQAEPGEPTTDLKQVGDTQLGFQLPGGGGLSTKTGNPRVTAAITYSILITLTGASVWGADWLSDEHDVRGQQVFWLELLVGVAVLLGGCVAVERWGRIIVRDATYQGSHSSPTHTPAHQ